VFVDLDPQGSSSRRLARERPGFAADLFDPSSGFAADAPGSLCSLPTSVCR
jgi:chromosome partitioning protein